jgi:hypothetical protein
MKKFGVIKPEDFIEEEEITDTFKYDDDMEDPYEENEDDIYTYNDEENEETYEDADDTFEKADHHRLIRFFNIIFIALIVIMVFITIDVVSITKYDKGPFFAIKTKTYKDGGTKVYYGIGYKVIRYNVTEGKQSTQIGLWSMPYSTEPTPIQDIDFAIEFTNDPEKAADKYYNQFLMIESTIKKVDKKNNKVILEYTDPDGKYTMQFDCKMASYKKVLTNYTENKKINIKGTAYKFYVKDNKKNNTVYMSDCFIEKKEESTLEN